MASFHHLLQHTKPRLESPAKVFAKLKSKVQREAMCAKDGIFTSEDPLCNVGEKHGAGFHSPRKKTKGNWTSDELKENHRFGSYRSEAQALTLSPISSPQKTFGSLYSGISRKPLEETPPEDEPGHGHTRRERAFMESTAMSQPFFLVNRSQIHKEPPQIRKIDGFTVFSRTPVKTQTVGDFELLVEECAPLNTPMSPAKVFSPMRKRLRKRKLDQQEFNKVINRTKEVSNDVLSQPQDRIIPAFSEDNIHNKTEDWGYVRRLSDDQSEMIHEPTLPPPRSISDKRCNAIMTTLPPMSPAKMFAYMKERESKKELQEVCNSSRRDLFNVGNFHQSTDASLSTAHNVGEMEDVADGVVPSNRYTVDSPDSQSDTDSSEDAINPAVPPQPVLLEDPLVLNSPQVSIPKKHEAVFKRNKWPKQANFPSESVIYLKKWFLRKNPKGLFVDGIRREDNIPWNSNIIVDRVSSSVLKTVSSRVYILVGKMKVDVASDFPKWFLKKFANGFPPNWKALYEKLLSEPRAETEKNGKGRGITAKAKSEASSVNPPVRRHRQKSLGTPDSCPPDSSTTKVSRSGRVIKPPLEYWKGGRVILDAFMNVTIHECYDTSICKPAVTTTMSAKKSQKAVSVFLPCNEGLKQSESANNKGASVLRRKVKPPTRNRAKINRDQKPSGSPEPVVQTLSSPEEWCGRTRSSHRYPAKERELNQSELEKPSTQRSQNQKHNTDRSSARASGRKRTVLNSPESPKINDKSLQHMPSDDEFSITRKGAYSKKSRNVHTKSSPNRVCSSTRSSESSDEKGIKKRSRLTKKSNKAQQTKHKPTKDTKPSPPTKPLRKSTQSDRKHKADKGSRVIPQEQDTDEWTEEELLRLQEAVSCYPKHTAGYWTKVARMVLTRSAEECHNQHTSQGTSKTPAKKAKNPKKEKVEAAKPPDNPLISARAGTLKRKQQVRQFLENMPKEDVDDVFSSAYMQNKRFEMPSLCPSDDHDCTELEPMTPMSSCLAEVKTPQCLHITPGMMGSPNRNDDKYVYQLQKRMKKNQFNVFKHSPPAKSFTPTPSVKRTMRRCGTTENDTFVVWEMFPGHGEAPSESGEEEDFYFSDND